MYLIIGFCRGINPVEIICLPCIGLINDKTDIISIEIELIASIINDQLVNSFPRQSSLPLPVLL